MKLVKKIGALTLASVMTVGALPTTLMADDGVAQDTSNDVSTLSMTDDAEAEQAKENLEVLLTGLPTDNEVIYEKGRTYTAATWAILQENRAHAEQLLADKGNLTSKEYADALNEAAYNVVGAQQQLSRLEPLLTAFKEVEGLIADDYDTIKLTDEEIFGLSAYLTNEMELTDLIVAVREILDGLANDEHFAIEPSQHIITTERLENILDKVESFRKDDLVLADLIKKANDIVKTQRDNYTLASIVNLEEKMETATTANELDTAIKALVNIAELRAELEKAEAMVNAEDYTVASWEVFVEAIAAIRENLNESLINNPCVEPGCVIIYPTQKAADAELDNVKENVKALVNIRVLLDLVTEANQQAPTLNVADYTDSSWKLYHTAKAESESFIEAIKAGAAKTKEEVAEYVDMVQKCIFGKEKVDGHYVASKHVGLVSIVEVKALIAQKADLVAADYLPEYWAAYVNAVQTAETKLKQDSITTPVSNTDVEILIASINYAYKNLMDNQINVGSLQGYKDKAAKILANQGYFYITVPGNIDSTVANEKTWHTLQVTLEKAESTVAPTSEMILELKAAIEAVEAIPNKGTKLAQIVAVAKTANEVAYMPSSYAKLQENIVEAQALLDSYSGDVLSIKSLESLLDIWNITGTHKGIYVRRTPEALKELREDAINLYSPIFDNANFAKLKELIKKADLVATNTNHIAQQVESQLVDIMNEIRVTTNAINHFMNLLNDPATQVGHIPGILKELDKAHGKMDELSRESAKFYAKEAAAYKELADTYEALRSTMKDNSAMKGALGALVSECEGYKAYQFEDNEWVTFRKKLDVAQSELKKIDKVDEFLDTNSIRTIVTAYRELLAAKAELKAVNAGTLKATIAEVTRLNPAKDEPKYTVISWHQFQAAIKQAQALVDGVEAAQTSLAIKQAQAKLLVVEKALDIYIGAEADVKEIIEGYYTESEADYTVASWKPYVTARQEFFNKLCMKSNGKVIVDTVKYGAYKHKIAELRAIEEAFVTAAEKLVEKDGVSLNSLIAEAEAKVESNYTPASWSAFKVALENAQDVLVNDGRPSIIIKAKNELRAAMNALVERDRDVTDFIKDLYIHVLNRDADATGLSYWLTKFENKTVSAKGALREFLGSPEYVAKNTSASEYIDTLYTVCLGRDAEETGKVYWMNLLASGLTRGDMLDKFAESTEFKQICDGFGIEVEIEADKVSPIEAFVTRFYTIGLVRNPDPKGLEEWVTKLTNQTLTGSQLAKEILLSDEFVGRNLTDVKFVDTMYLIFFNRAGDQVGIDYWMNNLKEGMTREGIIEGFAASNEYGDLCKEFGIAK